MLISVVIPLFNKGAHIRRAITSVLDQTHTDFELLIVDDGSTDDGAATAASFTDPRVRLIRQNNRGVSAARNRGIDEARGELIAFLDADDRWDPRLLESLTGLYRDFPDGGIYAAGYYLVEKDGKILEADIRGLSREFQRGPVDDYFKMIALGNNPAWTSAVAVPRAILIAAGRFNEQTRIYEDLELWSRIALNHPVVFTRERLAWYQKDADNRICNNIVPGADDLPFRDELISEAAQKNLPASTQGYIRRFLDKYTLLNAFKSLVSGARLPARHMAQSVSSNDFATRLRKYQILMMSYLPDAVVTLIWKSGVRLKKIL